MSLCHTFTIPHLSIAIRQFSILDDIVAPLFFVHSIRNIKYVIIFSQCAFSFRPTNTIRLRHIYGTCRMRQIIGYHQFCDWTKNSTPQFIHVVFRWHNSGLVGASRSSSFAWPFIKHPAAAKRPNFKRWPSSSSRAHRFLSYREAIFTLCERACEHKTLSTMTTACTNLLKQEFPSIDDEMKQYIEGMFQLICLQLVSVLWWVFHSIF